MSLSRFFAKGEAIVERLREDIREEHREKEKRRLVRTRDAQAFAEVLRKMPSDLRKEVYWLAEAPEDPADEHDLAVGD